MYIDQYLHGHGRRSKPIENKSEISGDDSMYGDVFRRCIYFCVERKQSVTSYTAIVKYPISNIRFRTVYQEMYTYGLPKKHCGRNKIVIHNFFKEQFRNFK